jgi:drug/metabolite transporter (DMT)-like permease
VTRGYFPLLLTLAALWGSSYLFIKVAVDEIEPAAMISYRLLLAALVLLAVLAAQRGVRGALADVRATGWPAVTLGIINGAIPFWLIAWGEKYIDSGVAAIANSTVPIFVVLLAIRLRPSERSSGQRLVGILIGLVGVGVLTGVHPEAGWWGVLGTLAVVGSSLCYAFSNLFTQIRFTGTAPLVIATAAITAGAVATLPFGLVQLPEEEPSWEALASVAALGVLGTAAAYLIHYRLVTHYGSARSSLVGYLIPVFALFYGAVILDEPFRLGALLGLGLILAGVALGSGLVRLPRRAAATAET